MSARKFLAKNDHLLSMLADAAKHCHERSAWDICPPHLGGVSQSTVLFLELTLTFRAGHNCLVTRWLPANERYHILQASVNAMSALAKPCDRRAVGRFYVWAQLCAPKCLGRGWLRALQINLAARLYGWLWCPLRLQFAFNGARNEDK